MTTIESNNIYELPAYLGFGIAVDSVRTEIGVSVKYYCDNEVVYVVECTPDRCEIKEFYKGEIISSSYGENLENAFFQLLSKSDPLRHPRFLDLSNKVTGTGNIHFIWPKMKEDLLFYPAGYLYALQQPVVASNHEAWERLKSDIINDAIIIDYVGLFLHSQSPGAIFRLMKDGTVKREDIIMVHLGCPLFNLTRAVEYCQKNGLIPIEKEYRMTVINGGGRLSPLNVVTGDSARGIQAYAVFEFGDKNGQIPAERAEEIFAIACSQPLKLSKN